MRNSNVNSNDNDNGNNNNNSNSNTNGPASSSHIQDHRHLKLNLMSWQPEAGPIRQATPPTPLPLNADDNRESLLLNTCQGPNHPSSEMVQEAYHSHPAHALVASSTSVATPHRHHPRSDAAYDGPLTVGHMQGPSCKVSQSRVASSTFQMFDSFLPPMSMYRVTMPRRI